MTALDANLGEPGPHFGRSHRHYETCGSTNDLARTWALDPADPAPHGALVTADFQTQGRGRRGRRWDAPPGQSALMSFVLRPACAPPDAWQIGFVAALAVADALASLGLVPRLKWPNDVLLGNAKVAGILIETALIPGGGGQMSFSSWIAVTGIGINVNQERFPAGDGFSSPPASLRLATGKTHDIRHVTQAVALAFQRREAEHRATGFAPILDGWQPRLAVGTNIRRGSASGTLAGLNADGTALICLADGTFANWASVETEEGENSV